jgi:hypothetical protein
MEKEREELAQIEWELREKRYQKLKENTKNSDLYNKINSIKIKWDS